MDFGNSLRMGGIAAMVLGCLYVLAPSVLVDETAELTQRAGQVETNEVVAPKLTVSFTTTDEAGEAVKAIKARLDALGVKVRSVDVDGAQINVVMQAGTRREEVVEAVSRSRRVQWFDAAPLLAGLTDEASAKQTLAELAGKPVPFQLAEVPLKTGTLQADEPIFPMLVAPPAGVDKLIVALDGVAVGLGSPVTPAPELFAIAYDGFKDQADAARWLRAGPLGVAVTPIALDLPKTETAVEAAPIDEPLASKLDWLLMKDTRLNLGIDLRGGIDLTLQVGVEDAILSRVHRDQAALSSDIQRDFGGDAPTDDSDPTADLLVSCQRALSGGGDDAVKVDEGWLATVVRADRDLPQLHIESDLSLAEVQTYVARRVDNYVYVDTATSPTTQRQVHTFAMTDAAQTKLGDEAISQVLETLRRRIDATGVKEPTIVRKGGGAISVQLPGMVDLQSAVDAIGTTAVLEFLLNDHELADHLTKVKMKVLAPSELASLAREALPEDQFADDKLVDRWLHENTLLPEDRLLRWEYEEVEGKGALRTVPMVLKRDLSPLTGADVNDAGIGWDQTGGVVVHMSFKPRGSTKFCEMTSANVGKQFAILLDDKIMSAPSIRTSICGGRAQIEMGGSLDPEREANNLSLVLRTGSLNAPVNVGEVRIVGSTLGADAIRSGTLASLIGSALVLAFMWLWYRTSGLAANAALIINVMLVFTCLALFGASLTLPGIAGIALTVGMAVDANIIIYERIREELRTGQAARKAVDVGFEKALMAVLDANITTAIAGVVLFSYGTGPIKGFAVTLLIGILTTLVSALFVNRAFMDLLTRSSSARLKI